MLFLSLYPTLALLCFLHREHNKHFSITAPRLEVAGIRAGTWHSPCTWPSAEQAPGCISLPGNHWQMVSLSPASFSPPAERRDDGLTYSAKCFVKAPLSHGSADFWGVGVLGFSALCAAPPTSALGLIHPAEEPWCVQGVFSASHPFLSWPWV